MKKIINKIINKETISYIFWGILATIINFAAYSLFYVLSKKAAISNIISWIICIIFQFWSNRNYVFNNKSNDYLNQFTKFVLSRVFTLIIEEAILLIFVDQLHFGAYSIKLAAEVIVIVLNYILSKYIVF